MGKNLVEKILEFHLIDGKLNADSEIGIDIDQTLTQDATGTMVISNLKQWAFPSWTELSVRLCGS